MADVEAMFHQVLIHPKDIDALRFLWYHDGDLDKEPQEFRILVHLFGGVWSSICAGFALRKLPWIMLSNLKQLLSRQYNTTFI